VTLTLRLDCARNPPNEFVTYLALSALIGRLFDARRRPLEKDLACIIRSHLLSRYRHYSRSIPGCADMASCCHFGVAGWERFGSRLEVDGTGDGRGGSPVVQTVSRGKRPSISVKIA
jgi:hypothetical protein